MSKGELENRDADEIGVGDLSEDHGRERGEPRQTVGTRIPNGPSGSAQNAASAAPTGSPGGNYLVTSVFDARPVLAQDINIFATVDSFSAGNTALPNLFQVPAGKVVIVRSYRLLPNFPVAFIGPNLRLRPMFNGAYVAYNDIPMISNDASFVAPVYFIADEHDYIGCDVFVGAEGGLGAGGAVCLYGNMLAKTSVPAQAQAANEIGRMRARADVVVPQAQQQPGVGGLFKRSPTATRGGQLIPQRPRLRR